MILSDEAIFRALDSGEIVVDPPVLAGDIRGAGLRVHLGTELLIPVAREEEVDIGRPDDDDFARVAMEETGYRLGTGDFLLACTRERIRTGRRLGCVLDGRSSIARQGLFVHCSSAAIDNVHEDPRVIVLELYNCGARPLRLRPGVPIAMLTFFRLEGAIMQPASSQYADQQVIIPPRASRTVLR